MSQNIGPVIFSWSFPSRDLDTHSDAWHVSMGLLALLLLIYSVWTKNFLFGIIVILIGAIVIAREYRPIRTVTLSIHEQGIQLDDHTWQWEHLESFWIAHNPPTVSRLYFTFKSKARPRLPISLANQNPTAVKAFLVTHLPEHERRRDREPISDQFGRLLKL